MTSNKSESTSGNGGFRVGPSMHVQLEYRVHDADGEVVGPDAEKLTAIVGAGQLLPAIERQIDGLSTGDTRRIKLLARDAYGPRDPDAVLEVERTEFPEDVAPGDYFEVENADRGLLVLRILEVGDDFVLVDMNHPLAGQDLEVQLTINGVRPATREELDAAFSLENSESKEPMTPLISPEALLRGPGRR